MIIRHNPNIQAEVKIDREVFADRSLSSGACRLYSFLCGLRSGVNYSDKYVLRVMDTSQAMITRHKRELRERGLFMMDKLTSHTYVIYIGDTVTPAHAVKDMWKRLDAGSED